MSRTSTTEKIRAAQRKKNQRIAGTPPETTVHVGTVPDGQGSHPITNMTASDPHDSQYKRQLPVRLGVYTVEDVPNDRTVNYSRRFEPTGEKHPAIVEKYVISCQDTAPEWHVSHAIDIMEKRLNGVSRKVENYRRLAGGFKSLEAALSMTKRLAHIRSTSDSLPDELDQQVIDNYRELEVTD